MNTSVNKINGFNGLINPYIINTFKTNAVDSL